MPDTRPALVLHYCRLCGQYCIGNMDQWITPHGELHYHILLVHGRQEATVLGPRCSPHCVGKAQPEEIKAGRRMYGEGAPAPVEQIRAPYESVFPDDDDV